MDPLIKFDVLVGLLEFNKILIFKKKKQLLELVLSLESFYVALERESLKKRKEKIKTFIKNFSRSKRDFFQKTAYGQVKIEI